MMRYEGKTELTVLLVNTIAEVSNISAAHSLLYSLTVSL